jgi:hypothetical protein
VAPPVAVGVPAAFPVAGVAVPVSVVPEVAVSVPVALDVAVSVPVALGSVPPVGLPVVVDVAVEVALVGAALEDPPLQAPSSRQRAPAVTAARLERRIGVMVPEPDVPRSPGPADVPSVSTSVHTMYPWSQPGGCDSPPPRCASGCKQG